MRLRFASIAVFFFATAAARADSVTFTILNANQSLTAGSTVTFSATAIAAAGNSGLEFVNGYLESNTPGLTFNDSAFNSYALDPLAAGQSFTGPLFALTLPSNAVAGSVYSAAFTLLGGTSGDAADRLGSQNVSITVARSVTAVTPEPASLLLLSTGALGMAAALRRRLPLLRRGA